MTRYVAALLVVLLVGVVGVLAIGAGYAKNENASRAKCSEATLDGTYLFAYDGFVIKDNEKVPFASSGYEVYDGNGHVKGVYSGNFGGEIIRNQPISGTYTVKAGCTGTVRYTDGTQSDQFLSPDGNQVAFVLTKSPEFVGGGLEVQGKKMRVGD